MAKDIQLNTGTGGDRLKARQLEDKVKHQQVLIDLDDGPGTDASGRLRVSNPHTLFSSKLTNSDKAPLIWDEQLETGAGITASTPTEDKPYIDYTSTLNTAGKFTRQTFRRFNYQPGKSQLIQMTGVLDLSGGGTGVERRIGTFDDKNGLFFEDNAGVIGVTMRTHDSGSPVDDTLAQTAWNLDRLDGTGLTNNPSGLTADWTKIQIFIIDFQWLSADRVRLGVKISGRIIYVHEFNTANISDIPWASTPNLPLRYQMITTASSPVSTMRIICASVIVEGGEHPVGIGNSEATIAHINANTADVWYALIGVRLKSTHLGCTVEPGKVSVLSETNDNFEWALFLNPTVAGTFTFADKANSCLQTVIGDSVGDPSANTVTNGFIMDRGFGTDAAEITEHIETELRIGATIAGVADRLVLAIRPLTINADIQGSLSWTEAT